MVKICNRKVKVYVNKQGSESTIAPVGFLIPMWNTVSDDSLLLCDGSTFSSSEYPELYSILGRTTLPDFTDRTVKGAGLTSKSNLHNANTLGNTQAGSNRKHTHKVITKGSGATTTWAERGTVVASHGVDGGTQSTGNANTGRFGTTAHSKGVGIYWYIVAK